jgi:hypothetical protein
MSNIYFLKSKVWHSKKSYTKIRLYLTKKNYLTIFEKKNHYEKSPLPKPHYLATKIQKITRIQLSLGYYNFFATIPLEI